MSLESQLYEADKGVQTGILIYKHCSFEYDVFLSFRGLDTRTKFSDHLYKALKLAGYRTFRDEDEIEPGENIKSELREAIRNSKMSVIVLSENYADSTACLFELQAILELQETSGHKILPVFYDVDPSQIKEQAEKLDFKNRTSEQVNAWKAALKKIARMKGIVSQNQCNGYETKLIDNIVEDVHKKGFNCHDTYIKIRQLSIEYEYVTSQAADVYIKVCSEMRQIWKKPKKEVVVWLRHVESLKVDVQRLEQEVSGESRVRSPVQLRKDIEEKIQEVAALQEKGRAFKDLLVDAFQEPRNAERIREYLRETLPVMVI